MTAQIQAEALLLAINLKDPRIIFTLADRTIVAAELSRLLDRIAELEALQAAPPAPAPMAVPDEGTPGLWHVRKREVDGELRDCFVAAPDCQGLPYGAEILGDDEYREDTGMARKLADCELIVSAVNARRAALAAAPAQEHATQLASQGQEKCVCTFAQRVVGDGCRHCNPQEYIDRLHKCLDEYREEADAPAQAQEDARDGLTLEELDQLDRAMEHFVEGEDTDVDWRLLTRAASLGYLECERFTVPPTARAAIDAARAAQGGA